MPRIEEDQRVTYEEAKRRVLSLMKDTRTLYHASQVGGYIWPVNNLHAQGLGAAASRILKRMEGEGLVRQGSDRANTRWGWFLV